MCQKQFSRTGTSSYIPQYLCSISLVQWLRHGIVGIPRSAHKNGTGHNDSQQDVDNKQESVHYHGNQHPVGTTPIIVHLFFLMLLELLQDITDLVQGACGTSFVSFRRF